MIVKICGITCLEDGITAAEAGADMLGFNFYPPSPRYISPETCSSLTHALRQRFPHLLLVGVFVNEPANILKTILEQCNLNLAQCSGSEPPGLMLQYGRNAYKALRPSSINDLRTASGLYPLPQEPPVFLIDAYRQGEYGGTGQTADWSLAAAFAARLPILLAGGLTPQNVSAAVIQVRPWGVDVASGVESLPGRKDPGRMTEFISAARAAAKE